MTLRNALLAAAMVAMPFAAQAQPVSGLYVEGGLGINFLQQENISASGALSGNGQVSNKLGPTGVIGLGWGFGNGFRAEIEGNYMANKAYSASGFNGGITNAGGWEQKFGGMLNGYYDFTSISPWIVPFVGAGIGYEGVSLHGGTGYGPAGSYTLSNDTKSTFGVEGMLGAAFPIAQAPGLAITAEYRFLAAIGDRSYTYTTNTGATGSATFSRDYNHALLIGFRYAFGAAPAPSPAPAPMAAPAPAPARSYLVFFDWDKATLTARAQQIIREAADNSTKVQYTRIEVNGYTDTSGTPQYNQGLSVRRAQAVAAELVKDGVPKNAISIQGFGETQLLVPTGPGVREPQNRRVEIIIR